MATLRLTGVSGMLPMAMSGVKTKGCEEQWNIKQAKKKGSSLHAGHLTYTLCTGSIRSF